MTMDPDTEQLRRLVEECIDRFDDEGDSAVDDVCRRHPDRAAAIRSRIRSLRQAGLLEAAPEPGPAIPDRLGDFRILEQLGSGGMGVVFLAEQESLHREVALKVVRPEHLYFPKARARFEREVEAVAKLDHPGIVRVYTVGEQDGTPYFAMERIHGASLADVLAELADIPPEELTGRSFLEVVERRAGTSDTSSGARRELFDGGWPRVCYRIVREVAEALDHAHARGILHRDLKPSNIMVTPQGRVLLLDFGLALAEGSSALTRTGTELGSLPYLAPEQVRGEDVDARTDVYGLGVTLYELLTLRSPYHATTSEQTRKRILEADPVAVTKHNPAVASDGETICLAAMAPEPASRFQTAGELAADLGRLLEHHPITARRAGALLRIRRWAQRHPARATALALGLVVLVLVAGLLEGNARAARAEEDVKVTIPRLLARVAQSQPTNVPGMTKVWEGLLSEGLDAYARLAARDRDDPEVKRQTARISSAIGWLRHRLGANDKAEADLRRAIALFDTLADEGSEPDEYRDELASALQQLGAMLLDLQRLPEAEDVLRRGLEVATALLSEDSDNPTYRRTAAQLHQSIGNAHSRSGRFRQARRSIGDAIALREKLASSGQPGDVSELARSCYRMAEVFQITGRLPRAEQLLIRAIELQQQVVDERPTDAAAALAACEYRERLAMHFGQLMQIDRARAEAARVIALRTKLADRFPEYATYRSDLGQSQSSFAEILAHGGNPDEALATAKSALESLEAVAEALADVPGHQLRLAIAHSVLATLLREPEQRERHQRASVAITARLAALVPNVPHYDFAHGRNLSDLAETLRLEGKLGEALDATRQAVSHVRRARTASPDNKNFDVVWGGLLLRAAGIEAGSGNREAAIQAIEQAASTGRITREQVLATPGIDAIVQESAFRRIVDSLR